MSISFPTNTTTIIDEIRGVIGRSVSFYSATLSGCSVCSLDPTTDTSTDSLCPVCSGIYWIETLSGTSVSGHIRWGNVDFLSWQVGGQLFDGDCRIQIKLKSDTLDMIEATKHVVADGKVLEIKSHILRGVPTLNRVLIDLIEKEKEE